MAERLQKILSQWGIASRRQSEVLIRQGLVRINGDVAHVGQKADPAVDRIEVQGKILHPKIQPKPVYILVNKPPGIVSTCDDPWGRKTVLDLLPYELRQGLHPVGRLDQDTAGALLLTNDGDFTFRLTHPKHHIEKTYRVWLQGVLSNTNLKKWQKGIYLGEHLTLPAKIERLSPVPTPPCCDSPKSILISCLKIKLVEGKNRQIRRVAQKLGHRVVHLHRTHIGSISLQSAQWGELVQGTWRHLSAGEVRLLMK